MNDYFPRLIRKIISDNNFTKLIHQVTIKFGFRQAWFKKRFESYLHSGIDRILKTFYEASLSDEFALLS